MVGFTGQTYHVFNKHASSALDMPYFTSGQVSKYMGRRERNARESSCCRCCWIADPIVDEAKIREGVPVRMY